MKVNGGSRTLPTRAFGRRQIAEVNAAFGAGQQKSPLSTFCQAYGDWSAGQLILTYSRPNRPMATVSQDVSCMQLTTPFPTPKRHVHLISTCVG
jgi:hypothetical protein